MLESFLSKSYINIWINSYKYPLPEKLVKQRRMTSSIWHVGFNPNTTRFSMRDYIKVSKKLRSNIVDRIDYDISIYRITGLLVSEHNHHINTTYLIRNVFDSIPYEVRVILYSPAIDYVTFDYFVQLLYKRNKLLYLRDRPIPESTVKFTYIVGLIPLAHAPEYVEDDDLLFEPKYFFKNAGKRKN